MKLSEITAYLETVAPLSSQESYDNAGLITGNSDMKITGAIVSLDCIESTVEEAIDKKCNLIIAHHPIVFKGMKRFSGNDYVSRTVRKAIKNDIAIYAIHTNLDNSRIGVNHEIGKRLGLKDLKVLAPKEGVLNKLVCFVPGSHLDVVREALFSSGAGAIGDYIECSFEANGNGTYKPTLGTDPYEGVVGERSNVSEHRLEVLVSSHRLSNVLDAMFRTHPYEEVAYEIYPLLNRNQYEGSGMVGELPEPMSEEDFLSLVKKTFNCGIIRHTALQGRKVKRVAFCGGSGSFLLGNAIRSGADFFITGDFKYHEFFDADGRIVIADIGHYESEQFTSELLSGYLKKNFPKFAVHLTAVNTNPINYF